MNKKIELLNKLLYEKIESDWGKYCDKELDCSKEKLFKNSYRNAIAREWYYFFSDIFEENYIADCAEECSIEMAIDMLLNLHNVFDEFVKDTCKYDSIAIHPEGFGAMFEDFIEGKCGIKIGK